MQEKHSQGEPAARVCLDRVAIVLFRPQLPENIGAAARAACNMGLRRLVVVQPADLDRDRMAMMATGPAERLLDRMEVHDDLAQALKPFQYIVGTTARLGGVRNDYFSPREIAARLVDITAVNDVALLFGPENWGLTNDELPFCHALVTIPTGECSSLNLAQAVGVLCYETWLARIGEETPLKPPRHAAPAAPSARLELLFRDWERALWAIEFFKTRRPDAVMRTVREVFFRTSLDWREASLLRAISLETVRYMERKGTPFALP